MYSKTIMIGRLGKNPDQAKTNDGKDVSKFSIAVNRVTRDDIDWFDCVCFGQPATFANQYLEKGVLVCVEGQMRINKFTDKEGVNRQKPELYVSTIKSLSRPDTAQANTPSHGFNAEKTPVSGEIPSLDNIPF